MVYIKWKIWYNYDIIVLIKDDKMIDIHTHILPGIDDGARDIYDTLEMASMAAGIGVTAIVATPHCNIPGMFDNYFGDAYVQVFMQASKAIRREGIPVQLLPGMEAFATYDLPDLLVDGKIMPLNQSRYVLMEFSFDDIKVIPKENVLIINFAFVAYETNGEAICFVFIYHFLYTF